jgi:SAM-dependent methyltransferase
MIGAPMNPLLAKALARRRELAEKFLSGDGVEIGALHEPLYTPPKARVRYLDRLPLDKLRAHYPELTGQPMVNVDLIDDGETLATIADGSLDFVIANHMLEHCENPLGAIRAHLRAVRKGGVLYYAVPDKRFSFDRERPLTTTEHFTEDDCLGPARSREGHFEEWVRVVMQIADPVAARAELDRLKAINYSIHFHVWDFDSFMDFVDLVRDRSPQFDFDWSHIELNVGEIVSVFTKR